MANTSEYANFWTDVLMLPPEVYQQMITYNDKRGPARTASRLKENAGEQKFEKLAKAASRVASTFDWVKDKSLDAPVNQVPYDSKLLDQAAQFIACQSASLQKALRPEGVELPTQLQWRVDDDHQRPSVIKLRREGNPADEVPLRGDMLELYRSRQEWDVKPRRG